MDQASKTPKNFNLRTFTFEDLKNNKSLISSKLEICCEDHSIHLPTKVKKISCLSQVQRRQNQRVFFCKRIEIEIVLIIHQYKFIFANHISFQLFDFLQLGNFVFTTTKLSLAIFYKIKKLAIIEIILLNVTHLSYIFRYCLVIYIYIYIFFFFFNKSKQWTI